MTRKAPLSVLALCLLASTMVVVTVIQSAQRADAGSLSQGSVTMVSANKDRTDSAPTPGGTFGSDQVAISEDGSVVAFVSKTPAELLVNDPVQLAAGTVTDTNGVEDVFVWDSRVPAPIGPVTTLVSWNATHTGAGGGNVNPASQHPIMAPGGLGIVFESRAKDLTTTPVVSDLNLYAWVPVVNDLFPLFLVNVDKTGNIGSNSVNSDASIAVTLVPPSAKVAFTSNATDLVNENSHGLVQVYVRDFVTMQTDMVSLDSGNTDGTISGASDPMIAANGLKVAFTSGGGDLKAGISGSGGNIWVRDLLFSTTELISVNSAGTDGTTGNGDPVISADGNAVAWDGNDPLLSATVHNGNNHIFYRFGMTPVLMVDTNFTGALGCNSASNNPGLSLTGTTVVFESFCTDIVPPAVSDDSGTDVFVRRFPLDVAPQLVSINDAGNASGNADSFLCPGNLPPYCGASTNAGVTLSADGTAVAFASSSNDIKPPPNSPPPFSNGNIFIRYPMISTTVNLTSTALGTNPNGTSRDPVISADGGHAAFVSLADDLVTPDTNAASDVFVSDLRNTFIIEPITAVNEADGTVTITITRTGNNGTTDTVDFETVDGMVPELPVDVGITDPLPAVQPDDYTQKDGTLTFDPGDTTKTITIDITDDPTPEQHFELFRISLDNPSGGATLALPGPFNQAYVAIIDDDTPQDWQLAISQQPPASARVGDTVTIKAMLTVDAGADALDVSALAAGAATAGYDMITFPGVPFPVAAGASQEITITARLTGAPGSATNALVVEATAALGANPASTKSAATDMTTSTHAVTATLAATDSGDGNAANVELADQITYTLVVTNDSATVAQLTGLPAGFVAPTGTTEASRTDGTLTVPANGTSTWTLTVDVDDTLVDGDTITQMPSGIDYGMSAIGLSGQAVGSTPSSFMSTVDAPVISVGAHTLTDVNGGNLEPGDTVDVSVTVTNTGGADATSATLVDTLTDLGSPTNVEIGAVACGACTTTSSSVTAPLGMIPAGASEVITFSVTVPASPAGSIATSSAVVTFAPASTGSSPTAADEANLAIAAGPNPVAADDSYTTDEDTKLTVPIATGVLDNDADGQNDPITAVIVSTASANGTVNLAADGSFEYQPDPDFHGTATFTYEANDGTNDSNVATVTITVDPVNDAPEVAPDNVDAVSDGGPVTFDVLANDSDPDGDALAMQVTVDPAHGDVLCDAAGQCTYTPDPGYTGPDAFQYAVNDGGVPHNSVVAAVQIDVTANPNATTTTTESTSTTSSTTSSTVDPSTTSSTVDPSTSTTAFQASTSTNAQVLASGAGGSGGGGSGSGGGGGGTGSGSGTLPATGSQTTTLIVIGLGLILLGSLALGLRYRLDAPRRPVEV